MMVPPVTSQQIQHLKTGVAVAGEGIPVLLLHGWGGEINSMWPVAEKLIGQGFQTHLLDLPGFGISDVPPETWDVPRYAEFVLAYLEAAELEWVHLVGHSFGGRISLVIGADHPERVKKLVLANSAGVRPAPSGSVRAYFAVRRLVFAALRLPLLKRLEPRVRQWFRQRFGSADYLNAGPLEETFKQVVNQDLVPYAQRIQAPTLLVWGDQDLDTPISQAKILEAAIPDAGLFTFEGVGHYSYLERLPEFVRIVAHFLQD